MGGEVRLLVDSDAFRGQRTSSPSHRTYVHKANVWYQPHPQFRMFLGQDPDGLFDSAELAGYEFHQGDEQFLGVMIWDFWRAIFPGNWDTFGLAFTYRPVRGLQLNLIIPSAYPSVYEWPRHTNEHINKKMEYSDMFPWGLRLNGTAAIPDIGTIYFSYIGPMNFSERVGENEDLPIRDEDGDLIHYGDVGLSFLLKGPVEGLQVQVGGSTRIPAYGDMLWPVMAGVAAHYTNFGELFNLRFSWGIKGRFGAAFNTSHELGTYKYLQQSDRSRAGDDENRMQEIKGTFLHGNIMPWITISAWTINLDVGMTGLVTDTNKEKEFVSGWWVSPYFRVGPLRAGVHIMTIGDVIADPSQGTGNAGWRARKVNGNRFKQLRESDGKRKDLIRESPVKITVPIAMEFNF